MSFVAQLFGEAALTSRIRVLRTYEEVEAFREESLADESVQAIDTEWYDYDSERHVYNNGLAFCSTHCYRRPDGELEKVYVHNYGQSDGNIYALKPYLENPDKIKAGHNVPVDWHIFANHGIKVASYRIDTMVMDHALDENRGAEQRADGSRGPGHDLKGCAGDHLGRPREDYRHTFGTPKLKRDGAPYASGEMVVPTLHEYLYGQEDSIECPTYEEALEGAEQEIQAYYKEFGELPPHRHIGPYCRWLNLFIYAVADAWDTLELYEIFREKMETTPWSRDQNYWQYFYQYETRITEIICAMERSGMYLDIAMMEEMDGVAGEELEKLESIVVEWAGVPLKITSDKQVGMLLFGPEGVPQPIMYKTSKKKVDYYIYGKNLPVLAWTAGGQPSVKAENLKALRKHLGKIGYEGDLSGLDALLRYGKAEWHRGNMAKIRSRAVDNRIRCRINQIGTTSGRFSTSNPINLQNITTGEKDLYHLRDCFCAPRGYVLIVADFSQLEYRLLAHFTQEPKLIRLFHEGWDLHSLTTYNIYPEVKAETDERFGEFTLEAGTWIAEEFSDKRKFAKVVNFETIYGVGHRKLAEQLGLSDEEAKRMLDGWFAGFPYVKAWMNRELAAARERGWGRTLAGRYRHPYMPAFTHNCQPGCRMRSKEHPDRRCGQKGAEERTFLNALIQGSAADMCKRAMIRISDSEDLRELGLRLTNQVHDELVMECPILTHRRAIDIIRPLMEQPFPRPLRVPMPVSIGAGPTWSAAKV